MSAQERYPAALIEAGRLDAWEGDDYAILRYHPKRVTGGVTDTPSQILLDFKSGVALAESRMQALAIESIATLTAELRDERRCRYILALPSHTAGRSGGPVA